VDAASADGVVGADGVVERVGQAYMKQTVEKRKPTGTRDYLALALTTWGVGYIPGAPGTYGSAIGVLIYLGVASADAALGLSLLRNGFRAEQTMAAIWAINAAFLALFSFLGIWASNRSIPLLGNDDPHQAVVDEVMGQLIVFLFIPFGVGWAFIVAAFLLFRLFDIWKPYPIDDLQVLPGGLGVCADDIVAGVYAGVCLAIGYSVYLFI
jgi:phosphatidylglycerophosphatase A